MDIDEITESLKTFYANNTELTIAVIIAVAIAVLIRPKDIGKILVGVAVIAIIGYLIAALSDIVSTGVGKKSEATTRTDKQYRDSEY